MLSQEAEKARKLIESKDKIEDEIKRMQDALKMHGVNMTESLIDNENYPRNDIDIVSIRNIRHRIICLQNDHKSIMLQIEKALETVHHTVRIESDNPSSSSANKPLSNPINLPAAQPFAYVNSIQVDSPAFEAGLEKDDEIVQFGSLIKENFQSLLSLAEVVKNCENKKIIVKVRRSQTDKILQLTPKIWNGKGLLGCHIMPIN